MSECISETLRRVEGGKENNLVFLVVDDSAEWIEAAKKNVKGFLFCIENPFTGYVMHSATSTAEGLELLKRCAPNLVVLDMNFKTFGFGYPEGIKEFLMPARQNGYIGLIIGWSQDPSYRWLARVAGADEFIEKTTSDSDLRRDVYGAMDFFVKTGRLA